MSVIRDRDFGRDVGRVLAELSAECRLIVSVYTRPRFRPSVGRDVGRVSAEISSECQPIVSVNTGPSFGG